MVNEGFCAPCQRLLADEDIPRKRTNARPHHLAGESFQRALESGCHICTQSWAGLGRPDVLGRTTYHHRWHKFLSIVHYTSSHSYQPESDHPAASLLENLQSEGSCPREGELEESEKASLYFQPWSTGHAQTLGHCHTTSKSDTWLSSNTGSAQSFEFLASKFKDCLLNHRMCSVALKRRKLPTRLLDVNNEDVDMVRLVDCDSTLRDAHYATLSHCWGKVVPFKLTRLTERLLFLGIPVNQLPKTFQHAVSVVRTLGIRYLWIDSLCIYQDSIDDWSLEAANMNDIYRNAMLNIAATAAMDGRSGLFHDRVSRELEPFKIDVAWHGPGSAQKPTTSSRSSYLCFRPLFSETIIDKAPLNLRAWVMQERLLSPRIVHYTKTQLCWECQESFVSELHRDKLPIERVDDPDWGCRSLKLLLNRYTAAGEGEHNSVGGQHKEDAYSAWHTFVYWYSNCALTFPEDRLVAFQGIARSLELMLHDELVAGLWRSRLISELCWIIESQPRPRQDNPWVAPSWSWASHNGGIRLPWNSESWSDVVELINVSIQATKSGALTSGTLKLRCRPIPAVLRDGHEIVCRSDDGYDTVSIPQFRGWKPDHTGSDEGEHDIFLVVLQEPSRTRRAETWQEFRGIVLVPSSKDATVFERAGMFDFRGSFSGRQESWLAFLKTGYKEATEQIITIV